MYYNIGVAGSMKIDPSEYTRLASLIDNILLLKNIKPHEAIIVSGLTNEGVPALAYKYALERGIKTTGIACSKVEEYESFDVDIKIIIGDNWGDESQTFVDRINCLVVIKGGNQTKKELEMVKKLNKPCFGDVF